MKELDLSEGHSSGIPTIQDELKRNGSPRAEFITDEDRRAMRIRIPIHQAFLQESGNIAQNKDKNERSLSEVWVNHFFYGIDPDPDRSCSCISHP